MFSFFKRRKAKKEQELLEQQEQQRLEQEALAKQEQERAEQEARAQQEQQRLEQEALAKQEQERAEQEARAQQEQQRLEQEALAKQEQERAEQEARAQQEQQRLEQEALAKQEQERAEQEARAQQEQQRLEQEALAKQEQERAEQEARAQQEQQRLEQEALARQEQERAEQEARAQQEQQRLEQEALARQEQERAEQEARAQQEQQRLEQEALARQEQERAEQEARAQQEQQRLEQEALAKQAQERAEQEARAQQEQQRLEQETLAKQEQERLEQAAAERQELLQTADLTITDSIFVEQKRSPTAPETEAPAVAPEPEVSPAAAETPVIAAGSTTQEKPSKGSWLSRLRKGLSRTGQSLTTLFVGVKVDEDLFEELETALIMADAGVEATESLLANLRARVRKEKITDGNQVKQALKEALTAHLKPLEKTFPLQSAKPLVVMIAGVNGAGKTTSIGKLAHTFQQQGASVLLAAGDTFRAAAREQLIEWGNRNNVQVIAQEGGNPGAVAFNAVTAGKSRASDVVMVDTAGRLPTQLNLMEELKKVKRAIAKADEGSPHECLLVVDGNTGQNALAQIKAFDAAIGLTGLVVTKLDGTAKGGILAAVAAGSNGVRPVPVYWIGVGEGMHDLQPFVASEFAGALLGD